MLLADPSVCTPAVVHRRERALEEGAITPCGNPAPIESASRSYTIFLFFVSLAADPLILLSLR